MTIFNRFAKYALAHENKNTVDAYNTFLREEKLTDEERKFISNNYMLMIKVGSAAKDAIPLVKNILK